jgi:hypothetical protein
MCNEGASYYVNRKRQLGIGLTGKHEQYYNREMAENVEEREAVNGNITLRNIKCKERILLCPN